MSTEPADAPSAQNAVLGLVMLVALLTSSAIGIAASVPWAPVLMLVSAVTVAVAGAWFSRDTAALAIALAAAVGTALPFGWVLHSNVGDVSAGLAALLVFGLWTPGFAALVTLAAFAGIKVARGPTTQRD